MQMIKKFRFLVPLLVLFILFSSYRPLDNSDPKDKVLITIMKYVLTQGHYEPQEINDAFSVEVYENFLEKLDPSKRYFLQSDIDEFSAYKKLIDDQIKSEDLSFFFLVHNRLVERMENSKNFYQEVLNNEFDFEKKETLDIDYENAPYAKNINELIDVWYKQMKFSTLSRLHDKLQDEADKQKEDSSYIPKSFEDLEKESRKATLENMNDNFNLVSELTYADWFATYVSCISEQFDPHTNYFSPSLKKRFDIDMAGKLEGIGARLQKKNDYTRVSELISGGPAWKQGELEVGDFIIKVAQGDEEPVDIVGMRLDDAIEYIKGKKGTEVRLTLKKSGRYHQGNFDNSRCCGTGGNFCEIERRRKGRQNLWRHQFTKILYRF